MRVVLTGGGSGGHVQPFAPIVDALRTVFPQEGPSLPERIQSNKLEIVFIGVVDEEAKKLFEPLGITTIHIPSGKLRRYASSLTILDILFRLPFGVMKALYIMWSIMPDVVISKGGYASIPAVIAAKFYRIPTILHESDSLLGMTNTLLGRWSTAIAVGFPTSEYYPPAFRYKTVATGVPVSRTLEQISKDEAKAVFGIPKSEKVLLVMGGSQGAEQINESILPLLPQLLPVTAIIHITGKQHLEEVTTSAKTLLGNSPRINLYKPFGYLHEKMQYALAACDAVITRAGASSLAEIARLRVPALVIPLATAAGDHQRKNAGVYEAAGAVLVLDPTNLGKHLLSLNVQRLITDEELRGELSKNLEPLDYPNASHDLAVFVMKLASGYAPAKQKS